MTLYESMVELQSTSIVAYNDFADIALKNEAIYRTVMQKRLERLSASAKSFVVAAREVNSLLEIYDDELSITIRGAQSRKIPILERNSSMVESIANQHRSTTRYNLSISGKITYPY